MEQSPTYRKHYRKENLVINILVELVYLPCLMRINVRLVFIAARRPYIQNVYVKDTHVLLKIRTLNI